MQIVTVDFSGSRNISTKSMGRNVMNINRVGRYAFHEVLICNGVTFNLNFTILLEKCIIRMVSLQDFQQLAIPA